MDVHFLKLSVLVHALILWTMCVTSQCAGTDNDGRVPRVVAEFRSLCPQTDMCYSTVNVTSSDSRDTYSNDWYGAPGGAVFIPCCGSCDCHSNCGWTCCPDYLQHLISGTEFELARNSVFKCLYPQFRPYNYEKYNAIRAYTFVVQCPVGYSDESIRSKCLRDFWEFDFSEKASYMLPLTSLSRNMTFKNYYCWLCHKSKEDITENVVQWKAELTCDYGQAFIKSVTDIPTVLYSDPHCNLFFRKPDLPFIMEPCTPLVDRCNRTGQWKNYDLYLEQACLSYTSVYNSTYKNVHCFLCNGNSEQDIEEMCEQGESQSTPHSFLALLDFNKLDGATADTDTEEKADLISCSYNARYDRLTVSLTIVLY